MLSWVQTVGRSGIGFCYRVGLAGVLLYRTVIRVPNWRQVAGLLTLQLYRVGVLSLLVVVMSALFIGMVIALQGYHTLNKFGATQELGPLLALSVLRELGPVMTAILFAGRAGSALTAEIGLMRATQQLASMEMMAVDPLWWVIAPRFWAGCLALPLLTLIFNAMAILGGHAMSVHWLGLSSGAFWSNMADAVRFHADVLNGLIKSVIFAILVTWIAIFQGYHAQPNAAGVAQATTKTVVYGALAILAGDFILTAIMMTGW